MCTTGCLCAVAIATVAVACMAVSMHMFPLREAYNLPQPEHVVRRHGGWQGISREMLSIETTNIPEDLPDGTSAGDEAATGGASIATASNPLTSP